MKNLLKETLNVLNKKGKTFDDVRAICGDKFKISLEDFMKYADVEYDGGFGRQEVPTDLKVIGDNWWLERHEYDDSEWWEFKTLPVIPDEIRPIKRLTKGSWDSLDELQEKEID